MIKRIKNIDTFGKNIITVFLGSFLVSAFNLLYQLLLAHKLAPEDFAAFNSLIAILMLFAVPLDTLRLSLTKYTAEFNAINQPEKIKALLTVFLKKVSVFAVIIFIGFCFLAPTILAKLKIHSIGSGYIFAGLLAICWITPIFAGGLQGLEKFNWFVAASLSNGIIKIIFALIFIALGFKTAGVLGAFLLGYLAAIIISYFPIRNLFKLNQSTEKINFKDVYYCCFPIMISSFCSMSFFNLDMILVKYYFSQSDAGIYALAQVIGKILYFLPMAIVTVMFPKIAQLQAKGENTTNILKRSLLYAGSLCLLAVITYNAFPALILKVLTGKATIEIIKVGRLFSISMSLFSLLYIFTSYFIALKDFRFVKYLLIFTVLQPVAIILFHNTLMQVQIVLCINSLLLCLIHLFLSYKKRDTYAKPEVSVSSCPNI